VRNKLGASTTIEVCHIIRSRISVALCLGWVHLVRNYKQKGVGSLRHSARRQFLGLSVTSDQVSVHWRVRCHKLAKHGTRVVIQYIESPFGHPTDAKGCAAFPLRSSERTHVSYHYIYVFRLLFWSGLTIMLLYLLIDTCKVLKRLAFCTRGSVSWSLV
jgi:hypothetical protein